MKEESLNKISLSKDSNIGQFLLYLHCHLP
nr:MAG TPA: hypothetical protein [Caudoviricetes sp.]